MANSFHVMGNAFLLLAIIPFIFKIHSANIIVYKALKILLNQYDLGGVYIGGDYHS